MSVVFLDIIFSVYFEVFNLGIHVFDLYHAQLFTSLMTLKSYLYNEMF